VAAPELEAQLSLAVQAALAPAAKYVAEVLRSEPQPGEALASRPDVVAVLTDALAEAQSVAAEVVQQAWDEEGGVDEVLISRLHADITRNFDSLSHLRQLIRVMRRRGPEEVQSAILGWARKAAVRAAMSVSYASGAARTSLVLADAEARVLEGESLAKRWVSRLGPNTCHWCRKLHGVTIALDADFHPHLGGPVAFPHQQEKSVATPAGARRYGLPVGTAIVYTNPPKPYHGKLLGPLLHPRCECTLDVVRTGEDRPALFPRSRAPAGFLSFAEIRSMPEAKYRSLLAFLDAALHELGQVLGRLRRRG
jgi:hypothetical protein